MQVETKFNIGDEVRSTLTKKGLSQIESIIIQENNVVRYITELSNGYLYSDSEIELVPKKVNVELTEHAAKMLYAVINKTSNRAWNTALVDLELSEEFRSTSSNDYLYEFFNALDKALAE